jgi:hypothetical protein
MVNLNDVTFALFQLVDDLDSEISNFPELIEIAEKWLNNDLIKMDIALCYNDHIKETDEPQTLHGFIVFFLEHPFILGDTSTLVGLKEFAEIIGWDKARLSTKYSRQREGKKVRPILPEPIQILASTPLWTKAQAKNYKEKLETKEALS